MNQATNQLAIRIGLAKYLVENILVPPSSTLELEVSKIGRLFLPKSLESRSMRGSLIDKFDTEFSLFVHYERWKLSLSIKYTPIYLLLQQDTIDKKI